MGNPAITRDLIEQVAQSAQVRRACRAKAARILPRFQRLAAQANANRAAANARIVEGTRPGAKAGGFRRPYARVEVPMSDEDMAADARAKATVRQLLRKASRA